MSGHTGEEGETGLNVERGMSTTTVVKGIDCVGTKAGLVGLGNARALKDEDVTSRIDVVLTSLCQLEWLFISDEPQRSPPVQQNSR